MTSLLEYFKNWKHRRLLKKRGWSQRQYDLHYDPDFNSCANRITDVFCGYPHLIAIYNTEPFTRNYSNWEEGYRAANAWCSEHCTGKWRESIHRVLWDKYGYNEPAWVVNEIGGKDIMFFAFKNQEDAIMFTLKWT